MITVNSIGGRGACQEFYAIGHVQAPRDRGGKGELDPAPATGAVRKIVGAVCHRAGGVGDSHGRTVRRLVRRRPGVERHDTRDGESDRPGDRQCRLPESPRADQPGQ